MSNVTKHRETKNVVPLQLDYAYHNATNAFHTLMQLSKNQVKKARQPYALRLSLVHRILA